MAWFTGNALFLRRFRQGVDDKALWCRCRIQRLRVVRDFRIREKWRVRRCCFSWALPIRECGGVYIICALILRFS